MVEGCERKRRVDAPLAHNPVSIRGMAACSPSSGACWVNGVFVWVEKNLCHPSFLMLSLQIIALSQKNHIASPAREANKDSRWTFCIVTLKDITTNNFEMS